MHVRRPPIVDRKVRLALVGCGRIASNHFEAVKRHAERCEVVDVCDIDPAALRDNPLDTIHGDDPLAERDAAVIVICDNGLRSSLAAAQLREQGVLAESVAGGLRAWAKDGNPVIPGPYRRRR